jgi:hypothetical protein
LVRRYCRRDAIASIPGNSVIGEADQAIQSRLVQIHRSTQSVRRRDRVAPRAAPQLTVLTESKAPHREHLLPVRIARERSVSTALARHSIPLPMAICPKLCYFYWSRLRGALVVPSAGRRRAVSSVWMTGQCSLPRHPRRSFRSLGQPAEWIGSCVCIETEISYDAGLGRAGSDDERETEHRRHFVRSDGSEQLPPGRVRWSGTIGPDDGFHTVHMVRWDWSYPPDRGGVPHLPRKRPNLRRILIHQDRWGALGQDEEAFIERGTRWPW